MLIEALDHLNDQDLVVDASLRRWRVRPRARAAVSKLIDLIEKGSVNPELFNTLLRIDAEAKECLPVLKSSLNHEDPSVVTTAANCLGLLGPCATDAVPALSGILSRARTGEDCDPQVSAAKALGRIGPQAGSAIPALVRALKCRPSIRDHGRDGPVDDCSHSVAAAAAETLGFFGPQAMAAVGPLIEAVRSEEKDHANWHVRQSAIMALGRIGPAARAAIPVLRSLASEKIERPSKTSPRCSSRLCASTPRVRNSPRAGLRNPHRAIWTASMWRASWRIARS